MTTGHVFIATSLDGVIARPDDSLDWLMKQPVLGEDHGFEAFMAGVDGLVMGRCTFQTVLGFGEWPYRKPVVVLSASLSGADIPAHLAGKVTISSATPTELMAQLAQRGWARAYIDGGQVIQSFLREGLIADMVITTVPVLIGEGRRLFGPVTKDIDLRLKKTHSFPSGLITTLYEVAGHTPGECVDRPRPF